MLTNIVEIDQDTYMQALKHNVRTGGNLIAFGKAGTGKTEMAEQAALAEGFDVAYVNLSVLEAPDLVGLPVIEERPGCKVVTYASPEFLPVQVFDKDGKPTVKPVVILFDELDKSKPELQNPLLEILQSHKMNGRPLAVQAIICTGNLPDEGAHSQPVSHALTNRCKVYKLTHSFAPWQTWAQAAGVNGLIVGFLSRNQEYLSKPSIEGDPTAYCTPSPRAWTLAAKDLDTTTGADSVDFQTLLVAGRVGMDAAVKFKVWLEYYRHMEPVIDALVEKGTMPSDKQIGSVDKLLVCAIGAMQVLANECRKDGKDKAAQQDRINKMGANIFKFVKGLASEFQIAAVKSTLAMDLIQKWQLTKVPDVMATYLNVRKAMKAE